MPKYRDSDLQEAIQMVEDGSSMYGAAKACDVPKSTLLWRVKNASLKARGRKTKLSPNDVKQLVNYAEFMSDGGEPVTPLWLRETGSRFVGNRYVHVIFPQEGVVVGELREGVARPKSGYHAQRLF